MVHKKIWSKVNAKLGFSQYYSSYPWRASVCKHILHLSIILRALNFLYFYFTICRITWTLYDWNFWCSASTIHLGYRLVLDLPFALHSTILGVNFCFFYLLFEQNLFGNEYNYVLFVTHLLVYFKNNELIIKVMYLSFTLVS